MQPESHQTTPGINPFPKCSLGHRSRLACTCRASQRQPSLERAQTSSPGLLRGQTVALSAVSVISLPKAIIRKRGNNLLLPQGSHDRAILNVRHKSGARRATNTVHSWEQGRLILSDRFSQVGHSSPILPFPKPHVPSPTLPSASDLMLLLQRFPKDRILFIWELGVGAAVPGPKFQLAIKLMCYSMFVPAKEVGLCIFCHPGRPLSVIAHYSA